MTGNEAVLEVRGLSRYYGSVVALESIDLQLYPGELLLVLGANGAGKSTLLGLLAGLLQPSRGEILINGTAARRRSKAQRRFVGYAGEQPFLYGDLSVEEALELILRTAGAFDRERLDVVLSEFRLADVRRRTLRECSQGIRRRAGLARAFLLQPSVLVLDEPLANLDWTAQEELSTLIRRERARGVAAVIAAHEDSFLREPNVRVLFLDSGRRQKAIVRLEDFERYKEKKR